MNAEAFPQAGTGFEPIWTTAQAAAFLGLSRKTVLNMCSLGEIPFAKNGRLNAYYPRELAIFRAARLSPEAKKPDAWKLDDGGARR